MQTVTTNPKTIQEAASQLSRALQQDKRNDGSEYYHLVDESPEWMIGVVHEVHNRLGMTLTPDDTIWEFISRCADALADSSEGDEGDSISEIEPDMYTSQLTAWLAASVNHVGYISQALNDFGEFDDGFKLLACAQKCHIDEIGWSLIEVLRSFVEEAETEATDLDEWFGTWADWARAQTWETLTDPGLVAVDGWLVPPRDIDCWWWLGENDQPREFPY